MPDELVSARGSKAESACARTTTAHVLATCACALFATACTDPPPPTSSRFPLVVEVAGRFPDLAVSGERVAVSFLSVGDTASELRLHEGERERTLASGAALFANWADRPRIAALDDGTLALAYLEKDGIGKYDYGVRIALAAHDGDFAPARWLHEHSGSGEHGFPSFAPLASRRFGVAWLDGRAHATTHSMALFARTLTADGTFGAEIELDPRVCDCCPTAAAPLEGFDWLVAYRDRGDEEQRDVTLQRVRGDGSHAVVFESRDGWITKTCPVNGPALAVRGARGALAWTTEGADGVPRVKVATFDPRDLDFEPIVTLAREAVIGRTAVTIDGEGRTWIAWLETRGASSLWRLTHLATTSEPREAAVIDVVSVDAGRDAGYAALAAQRDAVLVAFTEADRVRVARVPLR